MEATGNFHHEVVDSAAVKADTLLDDTQPLHPADGVFHSYPARGVSLVLLLVLIAQFATTRFLDRLHLPDLCNRESLKAKVLQQHAAFGQLVVRKVGDALVRRPTLLGSAEIEDGEERVHKQEVFDRVEALLAAKVALLVREVD